MHPETDGTTYVCVGSAGRARYGWAPGETDNYLGALGAARSTVDSVLHVAGGGTVAESVDWSVAATSTTPCW